MLHPINWLIFLVILEKFRVSISRVKSPKRAEYER